MSDNRTGTDGSENSDAPDDSAHKLRSIERGLIAGAGACLMIYGVGRLVGVVPAEVPPAWPFVAIGSLLVVEVLNK